MTMTIKNMTDTWETAGDYEPRGWHEEFGKKLELAGNKDKPLTVSSVPAVITPEMSDKEAARVYAQVVKGVDDFCANCQSKPGNNDVSLAGHHMRIVLCDDCFYLIFIKNDKKLKLELYKDSF